MWRTMTGLMMLAIGLAGMGPAAAAHAARDDEPRQVFHHLVTVMLEGGIQPPDDDRPRDLELYLGRKDGQWDRHPMGWAGRDFDGWTERRERAHSQIDHEGKLRQVSEDGPRIRLVVDMTIHPDPWVPGGEAEYEIELHREGNSLSGTFTGTYEGRQVEGKATGHIAEKPWPSPVEGRRPAAPGEHPRLLFRKDDLPALRERAATPEGKAMLEQLRRLLGSTEQVPGPGQAIGSYTNWHGTGYGLLYQLTGEQKYADLAREAVEMAMGGVPDRDRRYGFARPGGKLRAGSSYSAVALAYDLCYEAWDEDFRIKVAQAIQEKVFSSTGQGDLAFNTGGGQHSPRSNHYAAWNGGAGMAILAITGDPGTDPEIIDRANRLFRQRVRRALWDGYGDRAYFFEGHHCGRLSSNTGLFEYLSALRTAAGEDWIANYEAAHWLLTKWVYELNRSGGRLENLQRGMYAANSFGRTGHSTGGDFSQGFAIAPREHIPAILWIYHNIVEPGEQNTYDSLVWPHRGVHAFVHWPTDVEPKNPAEVLPTTLHDRIAEYFIFRSGWTAEGDIIVTLVGGERRPFAKANVLLLGRGIRTEFPGRWIDLREAELLSDGRTHAVVGGDHPFGVDFSGASGAELLIVAAGVDGRARDRSSGDHATRTTTVTVGDQSFTVLTLHKGEAPEVRADGRRLRVGGQTVSLRDGRIVFGQ